MTSAAPRTAQASLNSLARTRPRSPSGTSAGSLIDPASPCEAQTTTTRQPASARRASVPPHASDSSSGWAKMPITVRPARGFALASGTMGLHEPGVDRDVLVDHASRAETGDRALVDAAPIEIAHARQPERHFFEIVEDQSGDPFVNHLTHRASVERRDGSSAGHRFGEHQSEGFPGLNRVEQRAGASVEFHL